MYASALWLCFPIPVADLGADGAPITSDSSIPALQFSACCQSAQVPKTRRGCGLLQPPPAQPYCWETDL